MLTSLMKRSQTLFAVLTPLVGFAVIGYATLAEDKTPKTQPAATTAKERVQEQQKFFETKVAPLLKKHCVKCHSGSKPKGNLRLTTRAGVIKGETLAQRFL